MVDETVSRSNFNESVLSGYDPHIVWCIISLVLALFMIMIGVGLCLMYGCNNNAKDKGDHVDVIAATIKNPEMDDQKGAKEMSAGFEMAKITQVATNEDCNGIVDDSNSSGEYEQEYYVGNSAFIQFIVQFCIYTFCLGPCVLFFCHIKCDNVNFHPIGNRLNVPIKYMALSK